MQFYSTRNPKLKISFEKALMQGLSSEGGLFLPKKIPKFSDQELQELKSLDFDKIAFRVAHKFLNEEVPEQELKTIIHKAINFNIKLVDISDQTHSLELFHGPTLAFKDFGARFMAETLKYFCKKNQQKMTILAATSGDTGSAVAQAFLGADNIKVVLLYPSKKISKIQEMQITTNGQNITALEIEGDFDDCQKIVKEAFSDKDLNEKVNLNAANSINIARLIPQTFYYFWLYTKIHGNAPLAVSVPSGNLGNLTAGLFAKKMGLKIDKFIAAHNKNNAFPKYLKTGKYQAQKTQTTISNAMDVGNPSNFERIKTIYLSNPQEIKKDLIAYSFNDDQTIEAIQTVEQKHDYTMDPHGAVGYLGLQKFLAQNPHYQGVFLETAHPAKFQEIVEKSISKPVEIPTRLSACLAKKKQSIKMPPIPKDIFKKIIDLSSQ